VKFSKEIRDILFKRVFVTLGILLLIRIGTFLPVPGINLIDLVYYLRGHSVIRNLVSTFSGNETFVIGVFTLNIFPYINASILIQLLAGFSPELAKLQKEGDLEGKRELHRLTRLTTFLFAIFQSLSLSFYLKQILFDWDLSLAFEITGWLTTGAMIIVWLSEVITDYGLGNGASLLIYTNIISNLPNLTKAIFFENTDQLSILSKIGVVLLIFASLYGIVFLQEGVRIIPLISSKQLNQPYWQESRTTENYLPLRLNQAGVMPIILTTTLLVIPNYIANSGFFSSFYIPTFLDPLIIFLEPLKIFYWIAYFGLILVFSSFYAKIVLNPKDISDQFQKMAVTIPGIRPGVSTTFYLQQVMSRITLVGATILAILVTVPNFIESTLNLTGLNGLSTTSLLIVAGVVFDLIREIENIYYSNVYNDMY
jgi:preprotein translocase subunit SecY